jgi:hypothetical protein
MAYQGAYRNARIDCDFVAKGERIEEVIAQAVQHGKALPSNGDDPPTPCVKTKQLCLIDYLRDFL